MEESQLLERIGLNPKVLAGKPVIKGTRLSVEYILGLCAQGASTAEILDEYEGLTAEDLHACFLFAASSLRETEFMPLVLEAAEYYFLCGSAAVMCGKAVPFQGQ